MRFKWNRVRRTEVTSKLFDLTASGLAAQVRRFTDAGWSGAECWTMEEAYDSLLPRGEVEHVEKLEMFDERELMKQGSFQQLSPISIIFLQLLHSPEPLSESQLLRRDCSCD